MNSKNLKYIIGGLVGLLAIVWLAVVYFGVFSSKPEATVEDKKQAVSLAQPVDIVLDFYAEWLDAVKSTSTNPYQLELHNRPILSGQLRDRLAESSTTESVTLDPVLCQTVVPEGTTGRVVFALEDKAQILIMSRDKSVYEQAIVTLNKLNDGWYIDNITCSPGEFAPDREFSFEHEGFLLKNVPPPLNPEYWYIVFEENNEKGHSAPLFFSSESTCIATDGNESTCDVGKFREATKAHIFGQMTERGVDVARIQFLE